MSLARVAIPSARLTEGKVYPFSIAKVIDLGPGDDWFVMKDPKGYKILVPRAYYIDYGFSEGDTVTCRVDKINCSGRIFIEPLHPHYVEGNAYDFEVTGREAKQGILGEKELFFTVCDVLGKSWNVRVFSAELWSSSPANIRCLVDRIKKGKLFLHVLGDTVRRSELCVGSSHWFSVVDERYDAGDNCYYFVLRDKWGNDHLLRKKYYDQHGMERGQRIRCHVVKFSSGGRYILEPDHPCYETGKIYSFVLSRAEELLYADGYREHVLVVHDCHGEEIKFRVPFGTTGMPELPCIIRARVRRIHKGRPELEPAEGTAT